MAPSPAELAAGLLRPRHLTWLQADCGVPLTHAHIPCEGCSMNAQGNKCLQARIASYVSQILACRELVHGSSEQRGLRKIIFLVIKASDGQHR